MDFDSHKPKSHSSRRISIDPQLENHHDIVRQESDSDKHKTEEHHDIGATSKDLKSEASWEMTFPDTPVMSDSLVPPQSLTNNNQSQEPEPETKTSDQTLNEVKTSSEIRGLQAPNVTPFQKIINSTKIEESDNSEQAQDNPQNPDESDSHSPTVFPNDQDDTVKTDLSETDTFGTQDEDLGEEVKPETANKIPTPVINHITELKTKDHSKQMAEISQKQSSGGGLAKVLLVLGPLFFLTSLGISLYLINFTPSKLESYPLEKVVKSTPINEASPSARTISQTERQRLLLEWQEQSLENPSQVEAVCTDTGEPVQSGTSTSCSQLSFIWDGVVSKNPNQTMDGYYVYYGTETNPDLTKNTAYSEVIDPVLKGNFQTGLVFTPPPAVPGETFHLFIRSAATEGENQVYGYDIYHEATNTIIPAREIFTITYE